MCSHNWYNSCNTVIVKSFAMNNYQFLEKIGEGSNGDIYRANDLVNNRQVAIKKVYCYNQYEVDNYSMMSQLSYIPQLYDDFIVIDYDQEQYHYLVIELIEGQIIDELIEINCNHDWNWKILYRILLLIQQLHQDGFYHGDISLHNIMLANDRLYLIDLESSGQLSKLRSQELVSKKVRVDYVKVYDNRTFDEQPDYINDNHGLERYRLLREWVAHNDVKTMIDEWKRIDMMIF